MRRRDQMFVLAALLLAGCEYPTESIRVISVHCVAGDSVLLPADDSTDVVLPCIDPRELPTDSLELPELPDDSLVEAVALLDTRRWRIGFDPFGWS